ncbi:MAG: hypothetical protein WDM94_09315 [Bauldia sp.]
MSFSEFLVHDARLIILRTLAGETSHTMNEVLLQKALESFGHNRTRDFVRTQIRALAEVGAVSFNEPTPTVMVAKLLLPGLDHIERRAILEGVARPSPGT